MFLYTGRGGANTRSNFLSLSQYCVTLTVGPALCLLKSRPTPRQEGHHTTACTWSRLAAGGVGKVSFTLLGLEPGEHTLTFTLTIRSGAKDIVKKTLRVVVCGP